MVTAAASAWEVPATRRYCRWLTVSVRIPAAAGVVLLLFALLGWYGNRSDSDARTDRASGTVVAVNAQEVGRGKFESGDITVEFPANGQTQRVVMPVGIDVSHFTTGQTVTVRYQASRPNNATVEGGSAGTSGAVIAGVFGLAILGVAVWTGYQIGFRVRAQVVVVLWDPVDEREMVFAPTGFRRVNPSFQPVTWLCGDLLEGRVAIAPPGGRPPLLARRQA
jgi:hypothetical protein